MANDILTNCRRYSKMTPPLMKDFDAVLGFAKAAGLGLHPQRAWRSRVEAVCASVNTRRPEERVRRLALRSSRK